MADAFEENALYEGDFIIAQTPVIFFLKKKKKQQTPQRLVLLMTKDTAALVQPDKSQKAVVKFPRNTVIDVSYNLNQADDFQYKLQLTVFINNKARVLCIEFPGSDACEQRELFVQHFESDKQKETPGYQQTATATTTTTSTTAAGTTSNLTTTDTAAAAANKEPIASKSGASNTDKSRRGTKRKPTATLDDALIYKRARHLLRHKYLSSLYRALVLQEKILSSQEFFDQYGTELDNAQQHIGTQSGLSNHCLRGIIQRKTWSLFELFQQDLQLQQQQQQQQQNDENDDREDNKRSIKVTLTREKILEIFVNLPEVRLAYEHRVPHQQSEEEFWRDFLQSHYFRRNTAKSVTSVVSDKEGTLDALLKQYATQLKQEQQQQQQQHHTHASSDSAAVTTTTSMHKTSSSSSQNSFARQLDEIQTAKNREVDVDSRVRDVNDEIARARALRNGESAADTTSGVDGEKTTSQVQRMAVDVDGEDNAPAVAAAAADDDEHKPLKRRSFKKKITALDRSVDLTATMDTMHETDDDPGVEEQQHLNRDDVQCWFSQMNKHQTMLLYQSLEQRNANTNATSASSAAQPDDLHSRMNVVPKVRYGGSGGANSASSDSAVEDDENADTSVMEFDYEQRLDAETEFEDLRAEREQNYVTLNIADQSVYWGEHMWLSEQELRTANERAKRLDEYLKNAAQQMAPLRDCKVSHIVHKNLVGNTIKVNTQNNAAASRASLASEQIENEKRSMTRSRDDGDETAHAAAKPTYYIYTQQRAVKTSTKLLEQLSVFQKQTKQLARHYWSCFPADPQRMRKAKVIQAQIAIYRGQLQQFQLRLKQKAKPGKGSEQTVLTQELIEFVDRIVTHFQKTEAEWKQKKQHIQQSLQNDNVDVVK